VVVFYGLIFSSVDAQSVYLSIGGGFSTLHPKGNYVFTYTNDQMSWHAKFLEMTGRKADIGFNVATALEFQLLEAPLSITTGLLYTQLYGRCDYVKATTPPTSSTIYTIGELTTRSNILTFQTGVQWQIIRSRIAPYVGLGVLYSIVGDTKLRISYPGGGSEGIVAGNTRLGLMLGVGVRASLHPSLDASIGADYSWINLVTPDDQDKAKGVASLTMRFHYKVL
jgi:hypothetical protein